MDYRNLLRVYWPYLALGITLYGLGITTGYKLYRPRSVKVAEGRAPGETLKDGSKLLPRDPTAKLPLPKVLPKDAKVERTVRLEFQPTAETLGSGHPAVIDLNVLSMPDGTTRILANSSSGEVSGIDIPREPAKPELKWAAGGMYSPVQKSYGVYADRDLGPLRLGLAVVQTQVQGLRSVDIWVKVGMRF